MNSIGDTQCSDILDSFFWDSTGHQESNITRKKERADSHIFYFRDWFNIMTSHGTGKCRYFRIYENSFSRRRSKLDEGGYVSLCACVRDCVHA